MAGVPIFGFVGPNGSGKTLCAVERHVRPALDQGRTVVATCWIDGGYALESVRQLSALPYGSVCLLDEIASCFPSRQSQAMPPEVGRILNQLRKRDITVLWTGPNWDRADKILREVTDRVTVASSFWDERSAKERRAPGASAWPSNRLFRWKEYQVTHGDAFRVGDTTVEKGARQIKPVKSSWYKRPKDGSGAQSLYRTLDEVLLLDHLDETGACFWCGGLRRREKCTCKPGQAHAVPEIRPWDVVQAEIDERALAA